MTDDTTAQAAEQKLAPKSTPSIRAENPKATPPASLSIYASMKDHYKSISLERVAEDLAYAIEMPGSRRKLLNQQVHALDAFFNKVLIEIPTELAQTPLLSLALKAQRQCQLTSASLSAHKKSDKRNDSSKDPLTAFLNAKI